MSYCREQRRGLQYYRRGKTCCALRYADPIACVALLTPHTQVESGPHKPSARVAQTAGMSKAEARRIQMLVRQREHMEDELEALQAEVDALVRRLYAHSYAS